LRFAREVAILGSLQKPGIPRLIESNVGHAGEDDYELYLAAEFIEGGTLRDIGTTGVSARTAVETTLKIVRIVQSAHEVDVVHRDIKPDNVVVQDEGGRLTPFLVDFGMAHIDENPAGLATKKSQEVGNRFLRLPEYHSGFGNKRDRRSDYTFCVGLLYYLLTKANPTALRDDKDNPPHARALERMVLRTSGLGSERLLRFFDTGFQNDIDKRFQTADALIAALEALLVPSSDEISDEEAIAKRLNERFMTAARRSQLDAVAAAQGVIREAEVIMRNVIGATGGVLTCGIYTDTSVLGLSVGHYFVSDPADALKQYKAELTVADVGPEQTATFSDNFGGMTETRIAIGAALDEEQKKQFRRFILVGIDRATSDDRFYTARALESSKHFPENVSTPTDEISGPERPATERPRIEITWFLPRTVNGELTIAWELRNVGGGVACDPCVFIPNILSYREAEMESGAVSASEQRFKDVKAYDTFTNSANVIVEFSDAQGHLYRQMGDVSAAPSWNNSTPDYLTSQLGHAYWVQRRIVTADEDFNRFQRTEPPN
jgi:serine/threonine protein kinase